MLLAGYAVSKVASGFAGLDQNQLAVVRRPLYNTVVPELQHFFDPATHHIGWAVEPCSIQSLMFAALDCSGHDCGAYFS